jgi:hypothetical protein
VQHGSLVEKGLTSPDVGRGHESEPLFPASGHQGDFSVTTASRRETADTRAEERRERERPVKPPASRLQPLTGFAIGSEQVLALIHRK